jgi:tetratricopeptide (TPR) repeat protein
MALIDAGHGERAAVIESRLASSLVSDERAAGKLLTGEALRVKGKARDAVSVYQEALRARDSWLGHFGLGLAFLDAHAFAEAYAEFETCVTRRGDAADYWLPSLHLVPPAFYYLARAQDGLGNPEAVATYGRFLAIEPDAQGDPLVDDAKRRAKR